MRGRRLALALLLFTACRPSGGTPSLVLSDAAPPAASAPSIPAISSATPPPLPASAPPDVVTDWCVAGLRALDEETCYVLPDDGDAAPRAPTRLLVYLHGIVPPTPTSPQKERVLVTVRNAVTRAHAAALVPRGIRGIGPGASRDWWAWPTEPRAHAKHAAAMVAKWALARKRLEALAGHAFERTYLAGSSNGAYFLTALALRGDLERFGFAVDAYAAMSGGGTGGRAASSLAGTARPFYVGWGKYDDETKVSAHALGQLLAQAGWPTREAEHPFAHGAQEVYVDEAFSFWDGAADAGP
jgi:predicted esterase